MNLIFYFDFELNLFSVYFLFPARGRPGPLLVSVPCRSDPPASLHLLPRSTLVSDPPFPSPRMPPALAIRGRRSPGRLFLFLHNTAPPRAPHLLLNRLRFHLTDSGHRRPFLRTSFRPSAAAVRHHQ
jgi:hypothetical protein